MSQNSLFNIDFEFQPDTVRLLPEGPIQVQVTPRYSADGVLDCDALVADLEEAYCGVFSEVIV